MKYFFLAEGWMIGRVWEFGGLWDKITWRRAPDIQRVNVGIVESGEVFWLHQIEDAVLMVEVKPISQSTDGATIGQVVIKRLINAEQVIERLKTSEQILN